MKNLFYIYLLLIAIVSCTKKANVEIQNLNGNTISVYGHGGMGIKSSYPINTFESIQKCLNTESDGVEFDVQLTADSVLVAFHGKDLSESTNLSGKISELTWAEIKEAKYKTTPYLNYKIITVNSIFSRVRNLYDFNYSMDCKVPDNHANKKQYLEIFASSISKLLQKHNLKNNVYIESKDTNLINNLVDLNLTKRLFVYSSDFSSSLTFSKEKAIYGISISNDIISKEQIELAHQNNLRIVLWGIERKKDNLSAVDKSPDFIQTEDLNYLKALLR
ncbi:MAG: glycerophosphodiester phosphodiesterase [Flavobacteriales bacterium]